MKFSVINGIQHWQEEQIQCSSLEAANPFTLGSWHKRHQAGGIGPWHSAGLWPHLKLPHLSQELLENVNDVSAPLRSISEQGFHQIFYPQGHRNSLYHQQHGNCRDISPTSPVGTGDLGTLKGIKMHNGINNGWLHC